MSEPRSKRMTNRDMQAAERKQQILEIAKRLFAEKGYHATSMRELNKEIGMAEALTYHYFPGGKLEILKSVLQSAQEERISSFVALFGEAFDDGGPLDRILLDLIDGIAGRLMKDQQYFQILIRERSLLDHEQKEALESLTRQPFRTMSACLMELASREQLRPMDFEMAASQFLSHVVVLIVQEMINGRVMPHAEMKRIADFYVQLWSK
ncbi:TetR/AcrR family transcriptional regulator [Paenibacillus stellifer]|nr:TetR/AcrR family transcriptional regulator [Paenibacillus stellifer]